MSKYNEQLEALSKLVEDFKSQQEIRTLLESMGYFALIDLVNTYFETDFIVTQTVEAYAGAIIAMLSVLFEPNGSNERVNNIRFALVGA